MTRFGRVRSFVAPAFVTLVALACLLVVAGMPIAAQQAQAAATTDGAAGTPPEASLQDAPDLVIFHTGEVKGALVPGG